jgi:hypothetical protein
MSLVKKTQMYVVKVGESEEQVETRRAATARARVLSEERGGTVTVESADSAVRIQYKGGAMFSYDERAPSGRR